MLIEIWERLRGYNKWIQTEATILSSVLAEPAAGLPRSERTGKLRSLLQWQSTCVIGWTDTSGRAHTASYAVDEHSRLFQLYDGQTISIRYNLACPGEYYLRELCRYKAISTLIRIILIAWFALYLLWLAHSLWRDFH
jgi:hypothetical protein